MTKLQLMQVWKFIAEMYYYFYSLFDPKDDLIIEGSYTKKLRSVIHNHELEKPKFEYFLNNVQNCKANCLRVPAQKDELEENTQMYSSEWNMIQDEEEEEVQQNTTGELTGDTLTEFLQTIKSGGYQRCNIRSKSN